MESIFWGIIICSNFGVFQVKMLANGLYFEMLNIFIMKKLLRKRDFGFQKSEPTVSVVLVEKQLAAADTNFKDHGKV